MKTLEQLLTDIEVVDVSGPLGVPIGSIRDDSRQVEPGDLFIAIRGHSFDGHAYVNSAAERGAIALVAERAVPFPGTRIVVHSTAAALGLLAANHHGRPSERMRLVGVTGTNGKTTTSFLVESMLKAAGRAPALLGTVCYRWGGTEHGAQLTTPGALELHRLVAQMAKDGMTHLCMEVSSIALDQHRTEGLPFDVACFTNLTRDHLDYHGTMEAYLAAKKRLFSNGPRPEGTAVALVDRPPGGEILEQVRGRVLRCSLRQPADLWVRSFKLSAEGISADVETPRGRLEIRSPLLAEHNLENILVALGAAEALGLSHEAMAAGTAALGGVPGRLEPVPTGRGFLALVDYAHTPDALERALLAVRPLAHGRVLVVFGCGGDRDPGKRPEMGRVAALLAERVFVTSDNPRTEDPQSILEMILVGIRQVNREARTLVEVDRRKAILAAVSEARPGDVLLVAGKGHEDYQIVGKAKSHFDDREVLKEALDSLGAEAPSASSRA